MTKPTIKKKISLAKAFKQGKSMANLREKAINKKLQKKNVERYAANLSKMQKKTNS